MISFPAQEILTRLTSIKCYFNSFFFFFFSAVKCLKIKNFGFVSQDFSVLELAL